MRILIAEDDLVSQKFLNTFISNYGECDITVDGLEAIDAFIFALDEGNSYDLICLDIMMPKLDGMKVLTTIRELEKEKGVSDEDKAKIIMMTALNDIDYVLESFERGCEAYAAKPIDIDKMIEVMKKLDLI